WCSQSKILSVNKLGGAVEFFFIGLRYFYEFHVETQLIIYTNKKGSLPIEFFGQPFSVQKNCLFDCKFGKDYHQIPKMASHNDQSCLSSISTKGITSLKSVKQMLKQYVRERFCKDEAKPSLTNHAFYPSKRSIRNHVYIATQQQKYQWNPEWNLKYFMLDYSNAELLSISTVFPLCKKDLCDFRREQAWTRWVRKTGNINSGDGEFVLHHLRKIAYSNSENDFQSN
uniref:Uncharacterized protein n=1 Tax=Strigamia maritima TaxID=126957 RepID=T1ILB1_STRMM